MRLTKQSRAPRRAAGGPVPCCRPTWSSNGINWRWTPSGRRAPTPLLASRALAITQAAVYDAVNAIDGTYAPYAFNGQAPPGASPEAAAATAAYHTLVELFPTRRADFDAALAVVARGRPRRTRREPGRRGRPGGRRSRSWPCAGTTAPTRSCPTRPAPTRATGSRPRPLSCRRWARSGPR